MLFESDEKLYTVIGKNIKKYRTIAGLTQVQLCEKTGISLSYLTKLESAKCDKSVSLSFLNLLANTLNVDITVFFKESD
uniref:helix-turn-helix domain-containing protein n=1 Tax=Ruminococcus bicirculans (ex Wegman et al. 2014) TaxID=1160721 RepID=UPI003FD83B71